MFGFIKDKLKKVYTQFTAKAWSLFSRTNVDEQTLKELEILLLASDTGVKTTGKLIAHLKELHQQGTIAAGDDLKKALHQQLLELLSQQTPANHSNITLLVGINGSGKTTFTGKLAARAKQEGKKVLLVAGDTFRAAATEQLNQWATRVGCDIVIGKEGQDPASVIFTGCKKFVDEQYDTLLIDTAGRLQTKANLMRELAKIKTVIGKHLPDSKVTTLLTIDAMLGQNSFEQARLFNESTNVDGLVLTKMDGTGKGGIVFSITQELAIPVQYISFGEQIDQFQLFNAQEYVTQLLSE